MLLTVGLVLLEEIIRRTLVDQDLGRPIGGARKFRGVVLAPSVAVVAKIARERLVAPGAAHGSGDRGKRRERAIALRVLERADERAVTAHGVAEDALARRSTGKLASISAGNSLVM
jgi:hypothetical protein